MGNYKDLTNEKFGRLVVLKYLYTNERRSAVWLCKCDCGNIVEKDAMSLKCKTMKSCGCLKRENTSKLGKSKYSDRTTHGKTHTRLYNVWCGMKQRCYNIKSKKYSIYGARGIKVCEEWKNDFMSFYNWAMANGYDGTAEYGKCTIDRINVNGNYEPNNCRWITYKEQANNRRNNTILNYNGETHNITEWSNILNLNRKTIKHRLKKGWAVEKTLSTPLIKKS